MQGMNLETVTDAEAPEEYCLLACCPKLPQSTLLLNLGQQVQGWSYHNVLGLPH